jgi:hypothetical protein
VRVEKADVIYHGSPLQLRTLRKDSTVTPYRGLARVFAHKPTIVSIDDLERIRHNGVRPGYLYVIDEPLGCDDVRQHPTSVRRDAGRLSATVGVGMRSHSSLLTANGHVCSVLHGQLEC